MTAPLQRKNLSCLQARCKTKTIIYTPTIVNQPSSIPAPLHLEEGDGSNLPHGLSMMNTCTKMATGSKQVVVVVKNLTAVPVTIAKGFKSTQVIAANAIPQVGVLPGMLEKLKEMQGVQRAKMSVEHRKEALFQQLDLSGHERWSARNWAAAHALQAAYHDIFSLEPGELGCTELAKHEIKVTDDGPFKERFWKIPPPMVDRVHTHVKEMLEVGRICPSQSLWRNVVVLVCKKDGGLCFYIDYCKLNARKRTLTCSHGYRKQLRAWLTQGIFLLGPKGRVLADHNGWGFKAIWHFYCREHRILWMQTHAVEAV